MHVALTVTRWQESRRAEGAEPQSEVPPQAPASHAHPLTPDMGVTRQQHTMRSNKIVSSVKEGSAPFCVTKEGKQRIVSR